jgi:hypothetical protein
MGLTLEWATEFIGDRFFGSYIDLLKLSWKLFFNKIIFKDLFVIICCCTIENFLKINFFNMISFWKELV